MEWPEEDVEIVASKDDWPRIRADPRFVELMRLARAANALSLAYGPLAHTLEDQGPTARRNRFAAFFFAAALMKEALDSAQSLGQWFREHKQYKEGFGALLSDPTVRKLRATSLDELRDKFVFHFDRQALADAFLRFQLTGDVRLITYPLSGPTVGDTYFDGADDAVLAHLFGDATTEEEYVGRVRAFMDEVAGLLNTFMRSSHRLIAIGLVDLGCLKRRMKRQPGMKNDAI